MEVLEVGVREFREKLSDYILHSNRPVAVTRHGATVGYFIPTRTENGVERLQTLREAGAAVDAMLARLEERDSEIENVVKEFAAKRRGRAIHRTGGSGNRK